MDASPPKTPQRGRNIYPSHLAKDSEHRVPLHRRGKSKTYECLEDLLREAGYKETRVFTPEAERAEAQAEERRKKQEGRSAGPAKGVSAMVSFLTGLVPWHDDASPLKRTQSLGSAARRQLVEDDDGGGAWQQATPTPNRRRPVPPAPIIFASDFSSPGSSSSTSSRSPPKYLRGRPPPGRDARSTLRHMISAPNIPQQRPPQPAPSRRATGLGHMHTASQPQPPMPADWMNTVSRAVVGAGPSSGAHAGGPARRPYAVGRGQPVVPQAVRETRHEDGHPRRAGSASRRVFTPHTPRAYTTPGVVTAASVMCRSAPGSRSTSLVRGRSAKGKGRNRNAAPSCVPSLGVTTVENDSTVWPAAGLLNMSSSASTIRLDSESDDDSDGGELDFARLIVPARRQHSIHSLRRHLHNHTAAAASSGGAGVRARPRPSTASSAAGSVRRVLRRERSAYASADEAGDGFLEDGLGRDFLRSRRGSIDEAEESLADWAAHGLPGLEGAVRKKRGAMPWTTWTQGR